MCTKYENECEPAHCMHQGEDHSRDLSPGRTRLPSVAYRSILLSIPAGRR